MWICSERNFYSHALMDCVKAFTGAILVSRRDGVQMHASHFLPPALPVKWLRVGCTVIPLWRTAKTVFWWPALQLRTAYARVLLFPSLCLRSSMARGSCLGRCLLTRRNFPDVWYKSKKKRNPTLSSHMSCRVFLVLFTFDAVVEPVYSLWWVGGFVCAR